MLDLNAIRTGIMQEVPYRWAFLQNLFPQKQSLELSNNYPQEGFYQDGKGFPMRMVFDEIQDITKPRITDSPKLNNLWQQLVNDLHATAYRAAVGELTGLNLMDDLMYIYFFRYDIDNFFSPHPDSPIIRMVQMFYFNQEWNSNCGGCLRILKDDNPDSVFQEIPPLLNTSVILVRSDNSWHTVTPVSKEAAQSRLTLKVAFINREEYFTYKNNT
ncbi:MAG: 2OG-Fe(II) oxygenase family protein [Nostoc sp.]|uniref:2OG-Fe(II) oxygenase family protein n=1 Tax=Nostoc sp. TaxID=1180 RepID=UPI002FF675B1